MNTWRLGLVSMCAFLSGCITAGQLNEDIATFSSSTSVAIPTDPCPSEQLSVAPTPKLTVGSADSARLVKSMAAGSISDLQLGALIIASSSDRTAEVSVAGTAITPEIQVASRHIAAALGFDLNPFVDQLSFMNVDGANHASAVWSDEGVKGISSESTSRSITYDRSAWAGVIQNIADATTMTGWESDFAIELGRFVKSDAGRAFIEGKGMEGANKADVTIVWKKYLVARYIAAYFRNGKIVELRFDDDSLKIKLLDKLKTQISDEAILAAASGEIENLSKDFRKALCRKGVDASGACAILGVIGEQTFVTRAGKSYGFPGVAATIDLAGDRKVSTNKIDTHAVIEDLVRVLLEAAGDALAKVPGVPNSTFCIEAGVCSTDAIESKLQRVNEVGDRAEGATTAMVGMTVRGGWLFSLNNEAIARSITTAAAVSIRKIAEAAVWKRAQTCAGIAPSSEAVYEYLKIEVKP